jgi:hypothetical protein
VEGVAFLGLKVRILQSRVYRFHGAVYVTKRVLRIVREDGFAITLEPDGIEIYNHGAPQKNKRAVLPGRGIRVSLRERRRAVYVVS